MLAALLRIGWTVKRQSGSHRTPVREGRASVSFAFCCEPSPLTSVFCGPKVGDKEVTKSESSVAAFFALSVLLAACVGGCAERGATDRIASAPLIIGEVLRYGVRQFAPGAEGGLCVAVREGDALTDPGPSIMRLLGDTQARPQSNCKATGTLIAGSLEWLGDDHVRVKASYREASQGERSLAYRVVREDGRWVCVGPILSVDPL